MDDPGASYVVELAASELEALVETMYLVAFADGSFGEAERRHFERSVAALTSGRMRGERFERVLARLRDRLARDGRAACVEAVEKRLGSAELRQVALILASDMAAADGVLEQSERGIIFALAEAFGMSEAVTREVLDGP